MALSGNKKFSNYLVESMQLEYQYCFHLSLQLTLPDFEHLHQPNLQKIGLIKIKMFMIASINFELNWFLIYRNIFICAETDSFYHFRMPSISCPTNFPISFSVVLNWTLLNVRELAPNRMNINKTSPN